MEKVGFEPGVEERSDGWWKTVQIWRLGGNKDFARKRKVTQSILSSVSSQCTDLRAGVIREDFGALMTAWARELWMCWKWFNWESGTL